MTSHKSKRQVPPREDKDPKETTPESAGVSLQSINQLLLGMEANFNSVRESIDKLDQRLEALENSSSSDDQDDFEEEEDSEPPSRKRKRDEDDSHADSKKRSIIFVDDDYASSDDSAEADSWSQRRRIRQKKSPPAEDDVMYLFERQDILSALSEMSIRRFSDSDKKELYSKVKRRARNLDVKGEFKDAIDAAKDPKLSATLKALQASSDSIVAITNAFIHFAKTNDREQFPIERLAMILSLEWSSLAFMIRNTLRKGAGLSEKQMDQRKSFITDEDKDDLRKKRKMDVYKSAISKQRPYFQQQQRTTKDVVRQPKSGKESQVDHPPATKSFPSPSRGRGAGRGRGGNLSRGNGKTSRGN